jgi:hypothetical protein
MKQIPILIGRENEIEHYQLLLGLQYTSTEYDKRSKCVRESFLEETGRDFAEMILDKRCEGLIGILNGYKITDDGVIKTGKVPWENIEPFKNSLINKLNIGNLINIPAPTLN